ncbi:MAG: LysR family transcriptional regulator [Caulobacteraceae bacterium]|nr:LysR family transcriptional regulator [Caulobacter sp.]
MDRLTSMAVFVKAAEGGSFTRAGAALGLTSQMVGKHVAALEQQVGAPLLQRTTRRQSLTETGRRFYERCRVILAEADAAYRMEEVTSATPRGRLRLSAPVGFGACWLAPVVGSFLERHPGVAVELNLTDRFVDLVDEGYDAALRLGPIEETRLAVRELCPHPQVLCAAPAYLARRGAPAAPEDLAEHACLGYINWSGRLFAEWRFGQAGLISPVRIRSRFQVNDGRVLVAAAVAGHGIILQPEFVVREALATGALQPLLTDFVAPIRMLHLVHSAREPLPAKLRTFIDHLLDAVAARSPAGWSSSMPCLPERI